MAHSWFVFTVFIQTCRQKLKNYYIDSGYCVHLRVFPSPECMYCTLQIEGNPIAHLIMIPRPPWAPKSLGFLFWLMDHNHPESFQLKTWIDRACIETSSNIVVLAYIVQSGALQSAGERQRRTFSLLLISIRTKKQTLEFNTNHL